MVDNMYTECRILITQGKNIGRYCGDVNKRCFHSLHLCCCGKEFTRDSTYTKHQRTCSFTLAKKERIKPHIVLKTHSTGTLEQKLDKMLDKIDTLTIPQQIHQHIEINNINITVNNGPGVFQELCDVLGEDKALDFVKQSAQRDQPIDVIEKLYLRGAPDTRPIASKDGDHFRYRDTEHRIIDDKGGNKIVALSNNIFTNILLESANNINMKIMEQNIDYKDPEYQDYILIQNKATSTRPKQGTLKRMIKDLAKKTHNPNHDFFIPGTEVINDDT